MERIEKIALDEFNYDPDYVAARLYEAGKIVQSVWQVKLIHDNKSRPIGKFVSWLLKLRKIDLPDEADPLFGLVEVLKCMRFWCWAIEQCIEIYGKDAPPELLEFYAADRREHERITNQNAKEE